MKKQKQTTLISNGSGSGNKSTLAGVYVGGVKRSGTEEERDVEVVMLVMGQINKKVDNIC